MSFVGAKVLLWHQGQVVTYLRDDRPGLGFAGMWDLPGGGREGLETPEACVLREVEEEFGLRLAPDRLIWRRSFPALTDPGKIGWFYAGQLVADDIRAIRFGDEGQFWQLMPVQDWLEHSNAVRPLQDRSRIALTELGWI